MRKKLLWLSIILGICLMAGFAQAGGPNVAVVLVDVQADFTTAHKGSLAVADSDQPYLDKVTQATKELRKKGLQVFATQDWHPKDHMSFAANHQGKKPFQAIKLADGRTQVLWPTHCVQNSSGSAIVIETSLIDQVVQKGKDPSYDSYSGFKDDGGKVTELKDLLKKQGVETIIVYGIATDYCVRATVVDGLTAGFKVVVVQDLCRGVAPDTSKKAWQEMEQKGALIWESLDPEKVKGL
ncbi:bifunctional nicotinamidase/pyrazinamidase [Dethiosulfatarculus sandiegensis]|uniref:nicotinamidase n=1 Tax=Dethiosulfatarculus sandiegensis TaxID=1429043 RepID=A0A0D2J8S0_9BACT|nr:bifunctional nicotinamidase/pyrazinamidase [Dethiosulfatarculus sandiegensis]KIX12121.1 amidase [Dethiosulfatarculus sandiegensis]